MVVARVRARSAAWPATARRLPPAARATVWLRRVLCFRRGQDAPHRVPAVSVADLLGSSRAAAAGAHPETVKAASIDMLWELVKMLATKASVKAKRPYLPVSAVCTWEKSVSYMAQVTALQAAKFKAGSKTPLRPKASTAPSIPRPATSRSPPTLQSPLPSSLSTSLSSRTFPRSLSSRLVPPPVPTTSRAALSVMLLGDVSAPSTPQFSSGPNSPKSGTDYFGDAAGASGNVNSAPISPIGSPVLSPMLRPSSVRPMSPMRAPPAQFNSDELRIKMLRHSSSQQLRNNFSRPLTAPGIPI